ncbi:MAG: hypothetical protein JWO06_988 [Bacteroidota bacterium]|nr:hypothetical protein [Bacteroidota bacterium]
MIATKTRIFAVTAIAALIFTFALNSCKKKTTTPPRTITYQLTSKDQLGVSGTVTFTETSSTVTTIDIAVTGADSLSHPAHIHVNSAVETGAIAISLNPVINGKSTTQVSALDNNTPINYSQLIVYDGYLNVHESAANLGTIIAQGDIGGNEITTTNKTYALSAANGFNITGTALLQKRSNGNTLTTLTLTGLIPGTYPANIRLGSVTTTGGGPVAISLNPVDGTSGKSYTNVRKLDSGLAITYDGLLTYDGYIAVEQSTTSSTVICQGNIGGH